MDPVSHMVPAPERPRIARLDPAVIAKIAAGEMILRASSVAKELIENALDAGARRIEITIGDRPDESLSIADDGIGMTAEELDIALEAHATSKLRSEEDLLRIGSLGFRGEALPSIGRVSRMEIVTAPEDGSGSRVCVEGGHRFPIEPAARSRGTTVRVEDLFFNSPVRKRFAKSASAEMRLLNRLVSTCALAFPEVAFRLEYRGSILLDLPIASGPLERVVQIHGAAFADKLLAIERSDPRVRIAGWIGVPELARPGTQHQSLLVSRRWVTAPWVSAALRQAFGDLLPPNRHPFAIVSLGIDPTRVDINVHPTKREIRFLDESLLFGELLRAAREQTERLVPTWSFDPHDRGGGALRHSPDDGGAQFTIPTAPKGFASRGDGFSTLERLFGAPPPPDSSRAQSGASMHHSDVPFAGVASSSADGIAERSSSPDHAELVVDHDEGARGDLALSDDTAEREVDAQSSGTMSASTDLATPAPAVADPHLVPLWQLHHRYVFAQTRQGLLIIDQHAAHERILYEQALARLQGSPATTQQLLFPAVVNLDPDEWDTFQEVKADLVQLGIDAEEFGRQAVLLRGVPALWSDDPSGLLRELLEDLGAGGRGTRQRFERLAASYACKSAIKSGRALTLEEMNSLVDQLFATRVPHGDPHGRPTFVQIALHDLDRRFGRH